MWNMLSAVSAHFHDFHASLRVWMTLFDCCVCCVCVACVRSSKIILKLNLHQIMGSFISFQFQQGQLGLYRNRTEVTKRKSVLRKF